MWSITKRAKFDSLKNLYKIEPASPFGGASDVCIFNRKRLLSDGWVSFKNEQDSDAKACEMYGSMVIYPEPFVAFIPFPPIPRMNLIKRIVASRGVSKIFRYKEMTLQEGEIFKLRDKSEPPIDVNYLKIDGQRFFKVIQKLVGIRY
jgi:hypothetical protein